MFVLRQHLSGKFTVRPCEVKSAGGSMCCGAAAVSQGTLFLVRTVGFFAREATTGTDAHEALSCLSFLESIFADINLIYFQNKCFC